VREAEPVRLSEPTENAEEPPPKSMIEFPVTVSEAMLWEVPFRSIVPPVPRVTFVQEASWLEAPKLSVPAPDTLTLEPSALPEDLSRTTLPPVMVEVPVM